MKKFIMFALCSVLAGGAALRAGGAVIRDNTGTGVTVNGGTLEMKEGALVTNNGDSGVRLEGPGVFTMNGGGVYLGSGNTFNMIGGEITGNTASYQGGGLFLATDATITGNPQIGGNNPGAGKGWIHGNEPNDVLWP